MSDASTPNPGPTPTGYHRTQGGGFKWQPPTAEHLSMLLPQYEIECILGHGGMGAVYKGKQKSLDRLVAIKILPPELDDDDASYVERFKNEAKVMAKFMHPAIVGVFDFGETSEGQLYIVMEYVDGTDVQKMIQSQGRLPPEHALAITAHVCDALRYAHEHGVIHRDIKPANILINMEGAVKVADFGLAKAEEAGASGLTKTGMAMGTPDYVAPEALVMGVNVDGRADLYAIGVMLYNMLTGNVPRGAFKPASVMLPGTDPRFDAIVQKAMQMDREERYQSAAEIRSDLDVILTTPLVQAGGQSSAAIPKAAIAQKPVAKGPQQKAPPAKAEAVPAAQAPVKASPLTWLLPTAVSAIVILGGAYYMGVKGTATEDKEPAPAAPKPVVSAPIKVREEPKASVSSPAKPLATTSSPVSVSKSSDPQFPPGQWVKAFTKLDDLPAEVRKPDSGVRFEDGRLIVAAASSKTIDCCPFEFSNGGIRLKLAPNSPETHVLLRKSDHTNVRLFVSPTVDEISVQRWKPNLPRLDLGRQTASRNRERSLEIVVVGKTLIARVDDQITFAQIPEEELIAPFKPLVLLNHTSIRDIEVINLDGLPAVEAIKILGVDEKGNDLRKPAAVAATPPAPAVSKSPPLPVPASSAPKFPPGQWVKAFTKFEDLPEDLRKPDIGVKFVDRWLVPKDGGKVAFGIPGFQAGSNQAIRLSIRVQKSSSQLGEIRLRQDGSFYVMSADRSSTDVYWNKGRNGNFEKVKLGSGPPIPTWGTGEVIDVEFGVVGQHLVGRLNGQIVVSALDDRIKKGSMGMVGCSFAVGSVELINLDGIPEAEALKILGVDEKGNDLRALAEKQEPQMAEQAKAVDAMPAVPELKVLHEQFTKLTAERVTAPFEADVAKLNTGYVGGLDREIANEKKAGHLDGVIALEAEKKLISDKQPLPAEDDDATPANLKALRQIYRTAFAKLEATRAANLKALTDPLSIRLKQLESTLTQQNRIDHAKTVREYRENLGEEGTPDESEGIPSGVSQPARNATTGSAAAKTNESDKSARTPASKLSPNEIIKWVLSRQGKVTIEKSGQKTMIEAGITIPSGSYKITKVDFNKTTDPRDPIPDTELENLSGLKDLKELQLQGRNGFTGSFLASLSASRELETLNIAECSFQPEFMTSLTLFPDLRSVRIAGGQVAEALIAMPPAKKLGSLGIHGLPTRELLQSLAKQPELHDLKCLTQELTTDHFKAIAGLKALTSLEFRSFPIDPDTLAILAPLPKLERLMFLSEKQGTQLREIETLKSLKSITFYASNVIDDAEGVAAKLALARGLEKVDLLTTTPDDEKFIKTAEVIQKALSKVKVVLRRP